MAGGEAMSEPTQARTMAAAVETPHQGAVAAAGDHPLTLDACAPGWWGWIDHAGDRAARLLNPILIKEARQALKSRQFTITFFLLLLASWGWTIMGVMLHSPGIYFLPAGTSMLAGYYFVLAIPMLALVPIAAHRSLASEIEDGTFEMLSITRLSALGIVTGKLNSAMLQMMIYFAALVPCLAFCYLLRGVALPTIVLLIGVIFYSAMLLTTLALLMATLATGRAGQLFSLLAVVAAVIFAEFLCAAFCLNVVLGELWQVDAAGMVFAGCFLVGGISCMVLFLKAAAARIAPVTENRSTPLRRVMFLQQLIWVGSLATAGLWYDDATPLNFGAMVVGGYWLFLGTMMLSESPHLSPRVQRELPRTYFGRVMLTWFNPGPGTGFMFAISSGAVGIAVLASVGCLVDRPAWLTFPLDFAALMAGYLGLFLGATRLISMPLMYRFGRGLVIPLATLAGVMLISAIAPTVVSVLATGAPAASYQVLEAPNWMWTLVHAFDQGLPPGIGVLMLLVGTAVVCLNLLLLFREFRYRRIAVPARVRADDAERQR